jgi:hypothetical protein
MPLLRLLSKAQEWFLWKEKERRKMATPIQTVLDQAVAQISAMDDVEDSAVALINTLVAQVQANINDPTALQAILDVAKTKTDALAAAVAAGTPAAPTS